MTSIRFGTDGWRAVIAEDYTFSNLLVVAQATANYLQQSGKASRGLVVGYDTRFLSDRFATTVAEVMAGNGVPVWLFNQPEPTPVASYTILVKQAAGNVIITASHNPYYYNGYKVRPEYAGAASPEIIAAIEQNVVEVQASGRIQRLPLAEAERRGLVQRLDPRPAYVQQIERLVDLDRLRRAGLTIVADAMFGAGAGYLHALLSGGKTRVIEIRNVRNPLFPGINPEPIPANLEALMEAVRERRADVGLATDGDADRIGVVDERGTFINQLQVYALLLLYLLRVREERGAAVRSVTSTIMADILGEQYGIPVIETPVGFKYIGPKMVETNAIMGGEESGGFAFRGHIPERDALLAGLYLLDLMVSLQRPMSGVVEFLREQVGAWYYDRLDIHFSPEQRQAVLERLERAHPERADGVRIVDVVTRDGFKFVLEDRSWFLIRPSGTEPLLRIYAESTSPERVERLINLGRQMAGV
ncbi:MAG TPA: phosphoglucomutase/phosphomannomutase family protein [Chloroflexota bacterium]